MPSFFPFGKRWQKGAERMPAPAPLAPSDLRKICDPSIFDFTSTADIEPLDSVIGQERAVQSITLGLNMKLPGYNIFITGLEGSGKRTIVQDIVAGHARTQSAPDDWCMVNNFEDEFRPRAICVPTGKATRFCKSMERLVRVLQIKLPRELESEEFKENITRLHAEFQQREQKIMQDLGKLAEQKQIQIAKSEQGLQPIPIVNGKPISREQFKQLPPERQKSINEALTQIGVQMGSSFTEIAKLKQSHQRAIEQLMQETALRLVKERIDPIRGEYADCEQILSYLDEVQTDIVGEVENFIAPDNHSKPGPDAPFPSFSFDKYKVNVLVDHRSLKGAPVVFEPNPSFQNLFGHIDRKPFMGGAVTDFTMVQAGSMLRANGGYLIVEVESILMDPQTWETLKRSLQNKQLYIQDSARGPVMFSGSLRPEPIALEVKVILVGNYRTFELLQNHDLKFNKIFKVRADFDYETELTPEAVQQYARFIARVCKENDLLPFTPDAVAAAVEVGSKIVAHQARLSLRFGALVGTIQEADYWARQENAQSVTGVHVARAMQEYRFRYNLYEEKIHTSYAEDTILMDVDGAVVGQVNALAVYQMGEVAFGRPSRITAETFMGKHGIVNIERESNMSGSTHDKGVLILSGYLGRTFARKYPLSLAISITFEQSYSDIDGDSASSTELYAILSSLSGVAIRQGIAVTGSVNQKGRIQAIGGVNEKIEGFFEVCKTKGLTGEQGVMIPVANIKNLMLKREEVQAVEAGQFSIWPVESIEQGIEILTGVPAGTADADGEYPADSVYGKVQSQLKRYLDQSLKLKSLESRDD
jgi:lon-related putative ATP-dependent protease